MFRNVSKEKSIAEVVNDTEMHQAFNNTCLEIQSQGSLNNCLIPPP
jgi:hypothetical protein